MKFYNRNKELQLLHDWEELSAELLIRSKAFIKEKILNTEAQ